MAMGVSTQSGPFKSRCSSSFWLSLPCRGSASTNSVSLSSHAFSASPKDFHSILDGRRELHFLRSANVPGSNITVFSISTQFKCGPSYSTRPFMEDSMHMVDRAEHPPIHWRLVVRGPSTSLPQMVPYHPYQIGSKGKLLSGRLVNLQRVDERKKWTPRCLHEPLAAEVEVEPCGWSSGYTTPEITLPKNNCLEKSKSHWLEESKKVKAKREELGPMNFGVGPEIPEGKTIVQYEKVEPKGLEDGTAHEKVDFPSSFCSLGLENVARNVALQNSFSQEYRIGLDKPGSIEGVPVRGGGKGTFRSYLINEDHVSHVTTSTDQVWRRHDSNSDHVKNIYKSKLDNFGKTCLSSTQGTRQSNGSLSPKLFEGSKEHLLEIIDNATKRDPFNGKFGASVDDLRETYIVPIDTKEKGSICLTDPRERLSRIYENVLVVDSISSAKEIVGLLTTKYRRLVYACDTEVAKIDVREETPVDHGEVICFSIYSAPEVDFGNGKSCIWVDVLDGGGKELLLEFAPFFENPSIKKVWHNYSFDSHVIENYGIKISGFHADTMHLARLWDSSRRAEGGYSLEALTGNQDVMSKAQSSTENELFGKISMKNIFGKRKIKKDGSQGKLITIASVEELQREERIPWICYSALDSISTLRLYESLKSKLTEMDWLLDGLHKGNMYDFYEEYWRPFGELLVKMETEGMLIDRAFLAEIEKVATVEQKVAARRFRQWASKYCEDALYMNVGSDAQLRQLFFGGMANRKDPTESLPESRTFKVPNVDKVIEEGKKVPTKFRNITLSNICKEMQTEMYTATGWPSVSGDALKTLAGKISSEYNWTDDANEFQLPCNNETSLSKSKEVDTSLYGTAYTAFGEDENGREACHAIAALCEVCSIDSLISNFILPLQSSHTSGKNGRIHCALNINTETGRLSARRPNLQNQPALEKDRYKIRQAFIASPGNSLIVADYGQLELRILAHLANCKSMLEAFKAGGDFHSRTAMNMYPHIREAVDKKQVLLEWHPKPGQEKPPVPLLKDAFASERRKAKMLNFSIAYGKTPVGLSRDWKVSVKEAKETVKLWYKERQEVLRWQEKRKQEALSKQRVHTLLGRARCFPSMGHATYSQRAHIERAAINTPVQGSAADVAMCAMLEISRNARLKELGWKLLLQVHDEVILEGPTESAEVAKAIVVDCMSKPFYGTNFLKVGLSVDAKCAQNWYAAK